MKQCCRTYKGAAAVLLFVFALLAVGRPAAALDLTAAEKAYLAHKPVLKAASIDGGAPLHFRDNKGQIRGIAVNILAEIAQDTGLVFEYELFESVAEVLASDAELYFGMSREYAPPGVALSEPYLLSQTVLFFNNKLDPQDLAGKKFALIAGSSLPEGILEENVLYYANREDTFAAVEKGLADYGYGNAYSVAYYTMQNSYRNIMTIPQKKEDRAYCLGLPEENELLLGILNKAILAISPERSQTLILDVAAQVEKKITIRAIFASYGPHIFAAVLLLGLAMALAIQLNVKKKKQLEHELAARQAKEAEINYLSYHDQLTGLYNRTYFAQIITELNEPGHLPLSLIIGDLNGLKLTNDVFGHAAGDRLLQNAARVLQKSCRKEDLVIRYGGDEFIMILPGLAAAGAAQIGQRILKSCQESRQELVPTSISLGWATKSSAETSYPAIIKQAEEMMYRNKLAESKLVRQAIIARLESHLYAKGIVTADYIHRLTRLADLLGQEMDLSVEEKEKLRLLVRLHDIGKVTVDAAILAKQGQLTETEERQLRKHVEAGYRIAESSQLFTGISDYILAHHERWDGQGYPQGLQDEKIPLPAQILVLIRYYDMLLNQEGKDQAQALEELAKESGRSLDPNLVSCFSKSIIRASC